MGGTQPEPEDREGSRGGDTRRESSLSVCVCVCVCVWEGLWRQIVPRSE